MTTPFWKGIRHRAEWLLVRLGAVVTPLFPRRMVEAIGSSFGWLASFLDREGRWATSNTPLVPRSRSPSAKRSSVNPTGISRAP